MIDFQNGGLEHQVYELIAKMCQIYCTDSFPQFKTTEHEKGKFRCELKMPDFNYASISYGDTEVESTNKCARKMLMYLEKSHPNDDYDPAVENEMFKDNIEQFFDQLNYNENFKYHLLEKDIIVHNSSSLSEVLKEIARKEIETDGKQIDSISEIVTLRFLMKKRK